MDVYGIMYVLGPNREDSRRYCFEILSQDKPEIRSIPLALKYSLRCHHTPRGTHTGGGLLSAVISFLANRTVVSGGAAVVPIPAMPV